MNNTGLSELKVPFALDENGEEVYPKEANKKTQYYCPDCNKELIFKSGEINTPHFAHKYDPEYCDFHHYPETENHLRAKWKVRDAVNQNKTIYLTRCCYECRSPFTQIVPTKNLHASLEYTLSSGHRADVAILDEADKLKAVIEIQETHPVDEEKLNHHRLKSVGLKLGRLKSTILS